MRKLLVLLLALLAMGALVSCAEDVGGGEDASDDTTEEPTDDTTEDTTDETTEDTSDDTVPDPVADGDRPAFCDQGEALDIAIESGDFQGFLAGLDELIADAPDEIKGDLETLRDAYAELPDDFDPNDPASSADALALFDSPEVQEASTNLEAFGTANCGAGG